jgi:CPA1 family monovalent cation:H+ antiporter
MEDIFTQQVLLTAGFLLTACLSSILLRKINFPYTIGLVIIGAAFGYMSDASHALSPLMHNVNLSSELILYIILPTLIFDAAINIDGRLLLRNIVPILLLAVFALLISAGIIAGVLSSATSLSLGAAMLFGVLISATDPVAVIALFNEVGAPKRLVTLVDGESIFNDATAIVLFSIVMAVFYPAAGEVHPGLWYASGQFCVVLLGGLIIGTLVGFAGAFILKLARKDLIYQTSVSFVMAYVSFIIADGFECSGILSTLAAGLVLRMKSETVVSRSNIQNLEHFWDYFAFIANSFVFLLLGITEIHIFRSSDSGAGLTTIAIAIAATLVARAVGIYTLIPIYNKLNFKRDKGFIPKPYQHILFWGGLRGAVPVALVLAIPAGIAERPVIIHLTFAFILFTLLVQGTTIKKMMDRFGVKPDKSDFLDKKIEHARYPFPSDDLAALVLSKVVDTFDEEGFFIRKREEKKGVEYLMKKRVHLVSLALDGPVIKITTEPQEMRYVNTIIYETLLTLNKTVSSIKDVVKPENLQQLVSKDQEEGRVDFDLCKYIPVENICTKLKSCTKDDVLREMVQILADSGDIEDVEQTLKEIMDREQAMTTGLGKGIATPHARTNLVDTIKIAVGVKREGIDFDALDGASVKIFFMILSPKNAPKPHLQVLSAISRLMNEPGTQVSLLNADSPQSFLGMLKDSLR